MTCETIRELLEEYALGTLDDAQDDAQSAQLSAHLADCPDCLAIYRGYEATLATLPDALVARSPAHLPSNIKEQVLARITADSSRARETARAHDSATHRDPIVVVAEPLTRPKTANSKRGRWHRLFDHILSPRRLRLGFGILLLLLVASLFWSIRLNVVLARERALRAEYMDLVGQQQELVLEIVDSNQTTRRVLRATTEGSRAYGKVFTRAEMSEVVAMAARLSSPPPGEAYHLWLTQDGETEFAGVMRLNSHGFGLLIYHAERSDLSYDRAIVTLQAHNRSVPIGEPILAWQAEP